jgi:iron complex outermembrane receptor protein
VSGSVFAADEEKATVLEEIIVTAERRSQNLQEVPLSITAFSDAQREKIGIVSIQDMANFAPGVSYNMATDRPSIRGVARQSNFFSLDSPVANYFDGVYTSSVQDAQRRPLFIERTEILRGPQGSLAGRGSIGGSINTISKGPKDTFGGEFWRHLFVLWR